MANNRLVKHGQVSSLKFDRTAPIVAESRGHFSRKDPLLACIGPINFALIIHDYISANVNVAARRGEKSDRLRDIRVILFELRHFGCFKKRKHLF